MEHLIQDKGKIFGIDIEPYMYIGNTNKITITGSRKTYLDLNQDGIDLNEADDGKLYFRYHYEGIGQSTTKNLGKYLLNYDLTHNKIDTFNTDINWNDFLYIKDLGYESEEIPPEESDPVVPGDPESITDIWSEITAWFTNSLNNVQNLWNVII